MITMKFETATNRCPICNETAVVNTIPKYHYLQSGLEDVYLSNGVARIHCPTHGTLIHVPNEQQVLQVLALELLVKPALLSPAELLFLRKSCGLTQSVMAKLLGLRGHATVAERELGKSRITAESDFYYRARIARLLWELHVKHSEKSFLAPVHIKRLKRILEHFTDLVMQPAVSEKQELNLVLDHDAWQGRAA
ncbi:MAG: hypothetical protein KC518_11265 [Candidatus Cloacimonetes bacterium]|nr:hypothetical protein [Candidatus Cloacimonadota bacterium]